MVGREGASDDDLAASPPMPDVFRVHVASDRDQAAREVLPRVAFAEHRTARRLLDGCPELLRMNIHVEHPAWDGLPRG
jgi:hypothetical protein